MAECGVLVCAKAPVAQCRKQVQVSVCVSCVCVPPGYVSVGVLWCALSVVCRRLLQGIAAILMCMRVKIFARVGVCRDMQ